MASKTLPDFIAPDLRILAIGINPSLHAVAAGFPFAFVRNRFWPALNASRLTREILEPGVAATRHLLLHHGIGFTDIVKRPSAGVSELRAIDYARGAPLLAAKIRLVTPRVLWFHGKMAAAGFSRYMISRRQDINWGWQRFRYEDIACFVSPNPSPANARYSLADLVASYDALADGLETLA